MHRVLSVGDARNVEQLLNRKWKQPVRAGGSGATGTAKGKTVVAELPSTSGICIV